MFLFCPNDGTLLLCEATPSTRFFCQTCSYTHAVTERITQVKKLTAKKITTVDNAASNAARAKTDSALLLRSQRVCSRALAQLYSRTALLLPPACIFAQRFAPTAVTGERTTGSSKRAQRTSR